MSFRSIPILAGIAMAATANSAFAFDAIVTATTALRSHASHRAPMIEVIPANAMIDLARCERGWCEAAYAGQIGYVYTPILVSGEPVSPPALAYRVLFQNNGPGFPGPIVIPYP